MYIYTYIHIYIYRYIYVCVCVCVLGLPVSSPFRAPIVGMAHLADACARRGGSSRAVNPLRTPPTAPELFIYIYIRSDLHAPFFLV